MTVCIHTEAASDTADLRDVNVKEVAAHFHVLLPLALLYERCFVDGVQTVHARHCAKCVDVVRHRAMQSPL